MTEFPATDRCRILLVDDHTLFCQALTGLFAGQPDCEIVAHTASAEEALRLLGAGGVDLLILDLDLGEMRGSELLVQARRNGYTRPVLVLTAGASELEAEFLASQRIAGIVRKDAPFEVLKDAVRRAAAGAEAFTAQSSAAPRRKLTDRERHVMTGVLNGLSNKEIASRLNASEPSVKGILQQLFEKAGVRTRAQLVRVALERYSDQL